MYVKELKNREFNFERLPADIRESVGLLETWTKGTFEADSEKLNLLDFEIFKAIRAYMPEDEIVNEVNIDLEYDYEHDHNDSFNSTGYDTNVTIDNEIATERSDIDNKESMATGGEVQAYPVGFRKDFLNTKILYGRDNKIKMPNGEVHEAKWAIVELSNILASHNEKTYGSTEGYPVDSNGENVNDRNYKDDPTAQAKILEFAQGLDPDRLVVTSKTPSGTPIISPDGIVVSGNNRTMSLKLAAADFPAKYAEYCNTLREEADAFGFKSGDRTPVGNNFHQYKYTFTGAGGDTVTFEQPVLVRVDFDFPDYNALELSKYNKDTKKAERPADVALKLGKILDSSIRCTNIISEIVSNYETFTDIYSNAQDVQKIKRALIDCNILTTQEIPQYFTDTGFTDAGKTLIEQMLAGLVLTKEALNASDTAGARKYRQTIVTSLPVLTANKALPENQLNAEINEALLLEAKRHASGLSFSDFITQTSIDQETFSPEAMYMNRLLASGRNAFKGAIEKYNESVMQNQGASLFGEKPSKEEIFEAHIVNNIVDKYQDDLKAIDRVKGYSEPLKLSKEMVEVDVETPTAKTMPLPKTEQKIEKKMTSNPFVDGNFYKDQPDNILATQSPDKDRWGRAITLYKGSIQDIDRIEVDLNFLAAVKEDEPFVSAVKEPVTQATDVDTSIIDNLENAVEASKKEIPKKKKRRQKADKSSAIAEDELLETYTAREVWDMVNPEVNLDELRAFMWWKHNIGRPIKSQSWLDIAEMTEDELYNTPALVDQWVRDQILFYFEGELIPAFLYLAENVYDKKNRLTKVGANSGHDMEYIVERYGQQVYDNQVAALDKVYKYQYDRRLMIRSEGVSEDEALVIQPVSDFAKNFKIEQFADGTPFRWKKITAKSNKRYGTPDFLATWVEKKQMEDFPELDLRDAFALWLRTDDTIQFQKGITYADIIRIYLFHGQAPKTTAIKNDDGKYVGEELAKKKKEEAEWERLKSKAKSEGERLFMVFLEKQLTDLDKTRLEMTWNREFNGYVPINYNKVPVIFRCNKYDMGKPMIIKPEKREAVAFAFIEGSGLLAYDVGVGKTPSAIFTVCQFIEAGYAVRPALVVPNQTYKQWIAEFKKFAAHIRINEFYNLDAGYIEDWQDVNGATKKVEEGSVSIMTYEGMVKLGFTEPTIEEMKPELGRILFQQVGEDASEKKKDKAQVRLEGKIEQMVGKHLSKTEMNIEDLGIDFLSFDEAHALKKVFTNVAGESEENLSESGGRTRNVVRYSISSGDPSSRGVKGFMLCQYIQNKYGGNTLMLTATPFTNSPLEIYSMLALVGYNKLKKENLANLNVFFDTFIATSYEMIINARLRPERRQIILGFNNLISLQTLIRRFMNHKTGEEVKVPRPNKLVLPIRSKMIDGVLEKLNEDEVVESTLPLSPLQAQFMAQIKLYANDEISEEAMCTGTLFEDDEDEDAAKDTEAVELDEEALTSDEKAGVRMLKAMNHARNLALSPYIFDCAGLGTPTAEEYVKTSNKLNYVMECIKTIKAYHEKEGSDMSGVVIYMDRGVQYFNLLREYLIKNVGFEEHEVGIISSKVITPVPPKTPKDEHKEYVKNLFLGKRFNKNTLEMEKLTGKERLKVVIGSSTIKEGINLQEHASCLFNCWLDWNPTDIQQLEGRIYRQKNKFKTVRIVNPLMIDSMDIFMFQKLEEKTSRINTIWQSEGKTNVLKTEDFNPKDLKYSLIKDVKVLAEMELMEVSEKIDEDIADAENKIKRNEKIKGYQATINQRTEDLRTELEQYRPLADGQPERNLESMLRLFQEVLRTQTDQYGKKMAYTWEQDKTKPADFYSTEHPRRVSKPFWFDDLNYANRGIKHETRNYLQPNGVTVATIDAFTEKIKAEIEDLKTQKEKVASPDAINARAQEIHDHREANQIEEKTVEAVVKDFASLNYLLSELVIKDQREVAQVQCPPLDENGKVRIDQEGLALLEECILHQPDTKRMHTNEAGEYTEERQKLHEKIIEELVGDAVCIENEQPIAVLTGGAPGSGKSTFLRKYAPYLQSDKIWKIDADEIREKLPEYQGWNASSTHQETRDIYNEMLDTFDQPCKHDLLYDGTMSNPKKYIPLIRRLKKMGYKVFIAYMDVPKEVSVERAMNRYRDNKGGKTKYGRYVPLSVIDDFFAVGKAGVDEIKHSVDGYVIVDSMSQKIIEKGGANIPQDRGYAEMFEMGKEKPLQTESAKPTKAIIASRLKLLKRQKNPNATIKSRIKLLERQIKKMGSGGEVVISKDGIELEKKSNKYKGQIFYDEKGKAYECMGYFPKLDDCVYRDLESGNEVVGCLSGFYVNDPTNKD